eukprot:TRINITY_DN507_c0_g3_i2.p1 TRINITY_DN507_c0_g3~~TRINITY_DN507_c0_g3_i2.p1  ORF type:complete len:1074 (+),score=256.91 TRINITY_DN507_c0_g3_i2:398-3223(+)
MAVVSPRETPKGTLTLNHSREKLPTPKLLVKSASNNAPPTPVRNRLNLLGTQAAPCSRPPVFIHTANQPGSTASFWQSFANLQAGVEARAAPGGPSSEKSTPNQPSLEIPTEPRYEGRDRRNRALRARALQNFVTEVNDAPRALPPLPVLKTLHRAPSTDGASSERGDDIASVPTPRSQVSMPRNPLVVPQTPPPAAHEKAAVEEEIAAPSLGPDANEPGQGLEQPPCQESQSHCSKRSRNVGFAEDDEPDVLDRTDRTTGTSIDYRSTAPLNRPNSALSGGKDAPQRGMSQRAILRKKSVVSAGAGSDGGPSKILEGLDLIDESPQGIFSQSDPMRLAVDTAVYVAVLFEALCTSWLLGTSTRAPPTWYTVAILLLTPIMPAFVWMNFRTAVVKGWQTLETHDDIRAQYLRSFFAIDIATSVPWDVLAGAFSPAAFIVGLAIRFCKVSIVPRLFQRRSLIHERSMLHRMLLNSFGWILIAHTAACSWIWVASSEDQGFGSDDDVDNAKEYVASLYWSLATLTSTGYGDISASDPEARALSLFWMCFGMIVVIFTGAKLTEWMVVTDPFALTEMDRKRKLHAFFTKHQIPWHVQKTALRVFPVVLESMTTESSIIDELPHFVQEEIRVHVKMKLIEKVPLFEKVGVECRRAIVKVTVPEEYDPDENIIDHGELGAEMFFLEHGLVEVYTYDAKGKEAWIANLKGGSHFGESALLSKTSQCRRSATVRAVTKCSVYTLPKESFDYLCELFDDLQDVVSARRSELLKDQSQFTAHMFRKAFAIHLFCTERPEDSRAKCLWRRGMRKILEKRYNRLIDEAEEENYERTRRASSLVPPTPKTRKRRQTQMPMVGTFEETIAVTPPLGLANQYASLWGISDAAAGGMGEGHPHGSHETLEEALRQFSAFNGGSGCSADSGAAVAEGARNTSFGTTGSHQRPEQLSL